MVSWEGVREDGLRLLLPVQLLLLLLLLQLQLLLLGLPFLNVGDASREGALSCYYRLGRVHNSGELRVRSGTDSLATRVVSSQVPRTITAHHQDLRSGQRGGPPTCVFDGRSARGWCVAADVDVTLRRVISVVVPGETRCTSVD